MKNINVTFMTSFRELVNFGVLNDRILQDSPLVFEAIFSNRDPSAYRKVLSIYARLLLGDNALCENFIANVTITSRQSFSISGYVMPSDGWVNGTCTLVLVVYSMGKKYVEFPVDLNITVVVLVQPHSRGEKLYSYRCHCNF